MNSCVCHLSHYIPCVCDEIADLNNLGTLYVAPHSIKCYTLLYCSDLRNLNEFSSFKLH
jgi:hypothetical protein